MSTDLATELGFDPTLKKKKKSKKVVPESFEENGTSEAADAAGEADLFAGLKKKKKKASSKAEGGSGHNDKESSSEPVDDITEALGELKLKKKKKKSKSSNAADGDNTADAFEKELAQAGIVFNGSKDGTPLSVESGAGTAAQEEMGLPYQDLLSRFFNILRANNPELAGDRSGPKFRIPPPVCLRDGKKTIFSNIQDISEKLQRSPDHLIQYLFAELGTSGSVDGQKRLVIKGKFQSKQMENVLRRYIMEYVTCKTCKSINTDLKKEQSNRLFFLVCKSCGSTRSVSSIKTGFQATVGKRRRM